MTHLLDLSHNTLRNRSFKMAESEEVTPEGIAISHTADRPGLDWDRSPNTVGCNRRLCRRYAGDMRTRL